MQTQGLIGTTEVTFKRIECNSGTHLLLTELQKVSVYKRNLFIFRFYYFFFFFYTHFKKSDGKNTFCGQTVSLDPIFKISKTVKITIKRNR